jgi:hypothetical protein
MFRGTVLAALALVMVSGSAVGQATSEAVDPGAISAVVEMGKRLRALKSFSVEAEMSSDEVLETGEKLTHLEHVKADVKPPSGLRVARVSTRRERIFFYNGERAVLWGPTTGYYTSIPFSGRLKELIVTAAQKYNYEVPLADLFLWGSDEEDAKEIVVGNYVGTAMVGDRVCDHYAFRQNNVDWQIWIDKAEGGLPCRYAIVDLTDEARPMFQATVRVKTGVVFDDARFQFVPPKDAAEIPFLMEDEKPEMPAEGARQ